VLYFPSKKVKKDGEDKEYQKEIPPVLIEGWKQNASPPLTAVQSLKPSVNKYQIPQSNSDPEIEEVKVVFNEQMESPSEKVRSPEQNLIMNFEVSYLRSCNVCLILTLILLGLIRRGSCSSV
jgi:hypothetical protein